MLQWHLHVKPDLPLSSGPLRAMSVSLFDAVIRTCYDVYEFTNDPTCALRIGLSAARPPVLLSDGTRIEIGELVFLERTSAALYA